MTKKKKREVSALPRNGAFFPLEHGEEIPAVIISVDEFESIRLVDYEGLSQEECGSYMNVSRATAQRIHRSARRKMAAALVEGRPLRIEGGEYKINEIID